MKITVETVVVAPLAQVWSAYTTPADIVKWNAASDDWHTTASTVDLREGGAFSSRMEAKDGSFGFDFAGTYTKVIPHKLIEYSFGDRVCTVEFMPGAAGVTVRVTFDGEATHSEEQQRHGWQAILSNFKQHVEAGARRSASMPNKNTICLWFDGTALEAATFYAETFPNSTVTAVHRAPADYPNGKKGDVLTVEFTVAGIACLGLNGGPIFKHSEAFSFQIATDDQAETDRLWNAIVGNGGQESACSWCKDKWGLSWQITPRALSAAITDPDPAAAQRAFAAMMTMRKIDISKIEAARRGDSIT